MISSPAKSDRRNRLDRALGQVTDQLLAELDANGHWSGELSSSALSTAVATIALGQMDLHSGADERQDLVEMGLQWLAANANDDGGWGDTIRSRSNISTTALCWAAFGAAAADDRFQQTVNAAEKWLAKMAGSLESLPQAIANRYGRDRTFSVPILMTLAVSGRIGKTGWQKVPALPFELAILPRGLFGALKLPVVSYALPALIAIGQAIHHHAPSRNPIARLLRNSSRSRTLKLLATLQPENGGFLEATPLTAFVTMSLASAGKSADPVAQKGAAFLRSSIRADGSWPIDTNLATWVSTLSIKGLSYQSDVLSRGQKEHLRDWLIGQQTKVVHPYTGAAAGAWAWTDLPGGVPDADDTAGALIALYHLGARDKATLGAVEAGIEWLINLQNRDGGIPTFCPGWGTLPFDRSTPEITAHTLRAWSNWRDLLNSRLRRRVERATQRAMHFLESNQRPDGSFIPLWFGNEQADAEDNPVFGTAQVLISLKSMAEKGQAIPQALSRKAAEFLVSTQLSGGGWGGDRNASDSIEETAVAVEALCGFSELSPSVERGVDRLIDLVETGDWKHPAPIGLYFARLWYYERLYPIIFSVSALGRVALHSKRS